MVVFKCYSVKRQNPEKLFNNYSISIKSFDELLQKVQDRIISKPWFQDICGQNICGWHLFRAVCGQLIYI